MSVVFEKIATNHTIVLCSYVINELHRVINRKYPNDTKIIDNFLVKFPFEYFYTPIDIEEEHYPEIRDKKDIPVLVSSILADVDVLLTGDKDYYELELDKPEILSPKEF